MIDALMKPVEFILHVDVYLGEMIANYGAYVYGVLALVVFCETGLVVAPFLPGDSLLFAAGAFASKGILSLPLVMGVLFVAAVLGDGVNYWIGRKLGARLMSRPNSRIFKPEYLEQTKGYFDRHGGKTIVIARFVPIVRTFAPFVAGVGHMPYRRFLEYNVAGGAAWVALFSCLGYFFAETTWVKENFSLAVLAVIFLSVLPGVYHWVQAHRASRGHSVEAVEAEIEDITFE